MNTKIIAGVMACIMLTACGDNNTTTPSTNNENPIPKDKPTPVIALTSKSGQIIIQWYFAPDGDHPPSIGQEISIDGGPWIKTPKPEYTDVDAPTGNITDVVATASTDKHGGVHLGGNYKYEPPRSRTYVVRYLYNDRPGPSSAPAQATPAPDSPKLKHEVLEGGTWVECSNYHADDDDVERQYRVVVANETQRVESEPVTGRNVMINHVAARYNKTCYVITGGRLSCVGEGVDFGLGYGEKTNHGDQPDNDLRRVIDVGFEVASSVVGKDHICAIGIKGEFACWGDNTHGQLGVTSAGAVGDEPNEMPPMRTAIDVTSACAGERHTCAVSNGKVTCWGDDAMGQLGSQHWDKLQVNEVTCGANHTCVRSGNDVYCWGDNTFGQLGIGSTEPNDALASVATNATSISGLISGSNTTCVVGGTESSKTYRCWGINNGMVVPYRNINTSDLKTIGDEANEVAIPMRGAAQGIGLTSIGDAHVCMSQNLDSGHIVGCWGMSDKGRLGMDGITSAVNIELTQNFTPEYINIKLGGLPYTPQQLVTGTNHTCVLLNKGKMTCWGDNSFGQIGWADRKQIGGMNAPNIKPITIEEVPVFKETTQ